MSLPHDPWVSSYTHLPQICTCGLWLPAGLHSYMSSCPPVTSRLHWNMTRTPHIELTLFQPAPVRSIPHSVFPARNPRPWLPLSPFSHFLWASVTWWICLLNISPYWSRFSNPITTAFTEALIIFPKWSDLLNYSQCSNLTLTIQWKYDQIPPDLNGVSLAHPCPQDEIQPPSSTLRPPMIWSLLLLYLLWLQHRPY